MNTLMNWEPFREMDSLLRRFLPSVPAGASEGNGHWMPAANISRLDNEYLIKADLPEVSKDDVKITLEGSTLTLSGERKAEKTVKGEDQIRVESYYGSFARSFDLPDDADDSAIKAEAKDGVLRIHIPRKQGAAPKQIAIQAH